MNINFTVQLGVFMCMYCEYQNRASMLGSFQFQHAVVLKMSARMFFMQNDIGDTSKNWSLSIPSLPRRRTLFRLTLFNESHFHVVVHLNFN